MRAIVVDPSAPGSLRLGEAPAPVPLPNEALVQVKAVSLNRGEVKRAQTSKPGTISGWDFAGVVARPAADGSGPKVGTRVVGVVLPSCWAEQVACRTAALAPLPDSVSFAQAATLPVAGLTALYALEKGGQLLGRRVLVTGASGGVGIYAMQLAALSGATPVALIRQARFEGAVRAAGAAEVVIGDRAAGASAYGPYHLILESVGGAVLADCLNLLALGGNLVSYGVSAGQEATIDAAAFFRAGRTAYHGLMLFPEFARRPAADALGVLVQLVADGRLKPQIEVEADWSELGGVAAKLLERSFSGKAVLHVA
jgi:NADPH:quinone reductase-like Zn-dependent oxidoreductase